MSGGFADFGICQTPKCLASRTHFAYCAEGVQGPEAAAFLPEVPEHVRSASYTPLPYFQTCSLKFLVVALRGARATFALLFLHFMQYKAVYNM